MRYAAALMVVLGCSAPATPPPVPPPAPAPSGHAYVGTVFLIGEQSATEATPATPAEGPRETALAPATAPAPTPPTGDEPGVGATLVQMFVKGSLAREAVGRVVKRNSGQLRRCYERALKTDPTLSGTLLVRFTITPSGGVAMAEAPDSTLPSDVTRCVTAAFARMTFPTSGGTTEVSYPITFTSTGTAPEVGAETVRACRAVSERPPWIGALRDAVQPCLDAALARDVALRSRVRLHVPVDAAGTLGAPRAVGDGDDELDVCVSTAASGTVGGLSIEPAGAGAELIVSIAFVGDAAPPAGPFALVTESSLQFEGEVLGSGFDWLTGTPEPFAALEAFGARLDAAAGARIGLRVDDRVNDYFLTLLHQELGERAAGVDLEYQDDEDQWSPLVPLGTPAPAHALCQQATRLVVAVDTRVVTLTFGEHTRTVSTDDEGIEPNTLLSVLGELSGPTERLAGRSDVRVTYGGASYGAVAIVVRTLQERGYFDLELARRP